MQESPEVQLVSTRSVGIKFGLIMGAVSVAYFMALAVVGIDMTEGLGRWSGVLINVMVIFLAHKSFKDNGTGYMSYGQGFMIGFWISLISSSISSLFTFVYVKYIDNTFIQTMLDKQEEAMLDQGLTDEQVEQAMMMTEKFLTPGSMLVFGVLGGILILLLVTAIVGIFTQKQNPDPFS